MGFCYVFVVVVVVVVVVVGFERPASSREAVIIDQEIINYRR